MQRTEATAAMAAGTTAAMAAGTSSSHAAKPGGSGSGSTPGGSAKDPKALHEPNANGFTKAQLDCLKSQILAFRKLKKGYGLADSDLGTGVKPLPLLCAALLSGALMSSLEEDVAAKDVLQHASTLTDAAAAASSCIAAAASSCISAAASSITAAAAHLADFTAAFDASAGRQAAGSSQADRRQAAAVPIPEGFIRAASPPTVAEFKAAAFEAAVGADRASCPSAAEASAARDAHLVGAHHR
jgi:hypothetical protein